MTRQRTDHTRIAEDGMHFASKESGSPFNPIYYMGNTTMSCLLCGKHRPREHLQSKRIFGNQQKVCKPSCKDLDLVLTDLPRGSR